MIDEIMKALERFAFAKSKTPRLKMSVISRAIDIVFTLYSSGWMMCKTKGICYLS